MSNELLVKHLKKQKKDLYLQINKELKKFNENESKITSLKNEIISYEVALETYNTMFPEWEYLESIDDDLFSEINGFVRLINLSKKQIEILNTNNEDLKNLIKTIQGKIVSINVDLGWIRDDEYE